MFQSFHIQKYNYDAILNTKPNFVVCASFLRSNELLGRLSTESIQSDRKYITSFNNYKNFLVDAKLLDVTYRSYFIEETKRKARKFFYPRSVEIPSIVGRMDVSPRYRGLYRNVDNFQNEKDYEKII